MAFNAITLLAVSWERRTTAGDILDVQRGPVLLHRLACFVLSPELPQATLRSVDAKTLLGPHLCHAESILQHAGHSKNSRVRMQRQ